MEWRWLALPAAHCRILGCPIAEHASPTWCMNSAKAALLQTKPWSLFTSELKALEREPYVYLAFETNIDRSLNGRRYMGINFSSGLSQAKHLSENRTARLPKILHPFLTVRHSWLSLDMQLTPWNCILYLLNHEFGGWMYVWLTKYKKSSQYLELQDTVQTRLFTGCTRWVELQI